jgi:hypothetical protein
VDLIIVACDCPTDGLPTALILYDGPDATVTSDWFLRGQAEANADLLAESGWSVMRKFPEANEPQAPDHTPENIARIFIKAKSAQRRGDRDSAAFLYRKAIEVAVKDLDTAERKGTLQARIDALAAKDTVPRQVGEWAHEVRIIANEAVHEEEEPTEEEVQQIAEFAEAFLQYVFTMAEKYRRRQVLKSR